MKLLFTSFIGVPEYYSPGEWLDRIPHYTGILEALSFNHEVISIERINYSGQFTRNGVHYQFINIGAGENYLPLRMLRFIAHHKPDAVFVNGFVFPAQIMQLRLALGAAVKIIILHRAERPFAGWKRQLQKWAARCIDHYLFTSTELANEWLTAGVFKNPDKFREIIQASSAFGNGIHAGDNGPAYLWVGRLNDNKDPITVVNAFLRFSAEVPGARLYMIFQSGELLEKIEDILRERGDAVKLIGRVDHSALGSWYRKASFIISGSHHEGSGIAVSEAMSCGCIPVLTEIPSFSRMTGPGRCGILYRPGDVESLVHALLKTTKMDLQSERQRVKEQFRKELSFEAIATKINALLC